MNHRAIETEHFQLMLPDGPWSDQSDAESFDFCRADSEQVVVVVHLAKKRLRSKQLQKSVTDLLKHRLTALQTLSGNACQFEPPILAELSSKFFVRVVGCDLRNDVQIQVGLFGTPDKVVVVSHYHFTGNDPGDDFKQRSDELFASVQVK